MNYFTTKVEDLNNLAAELTRLKAASHTIVQVISYNGKLVIISTTA